jgi:hypothetical protein
MYYGYKHWTTEVTPRCFYVGKGKQKRPYEGAGNRSKKWCAVVERFGLHVEICVGPITDCEAISWEIRNIETEDTFTTSYSTKEGTDIRCNFTRGGDGAAGYKHTDAHKTYIGRISKGRPGRKWTDEERARMSELRRGVPKPKGFAETVGKRRRRPVQQLDESGNVIVEFESGISASRATGLSPAAISMHCQGKRDLQLWRFRPDAQS